MADYPTSVWDGDTGTRDPGQRKHPSAHDWNRMIQELAATQTQLDTVSSEIVIGTLAYLDKAILIADGNSYEELAVIGDIAITNAGS